MSRTDRPWVAEDSDTNQIRTDHIEVSAMFPSDSHSMNQMHAAEMHVAHQRRTRGKVVMPEERRWHRALLAKLTPTRDKNAARPAPAVPAALPRPKVRTNNYIQLIKGSTPRQLGG